MAKSISRRLADSASPTGAIDGTLSTAVQTNITSLGTLSALAVSGALTVDTNTLVVDATNNRVGIGTSSPLTLSGNAAPGLTVSSNGPFILLQDANNADKVRYISNNTGELQFGIVDDDGATGKTEHMRIDSSGNVGIGTSSPSASMGPGLHIATASGNSLILQKATGAAMQFRSDASTIRASISGIDGADGLTIATGAAQTERMRITSAGGIEIPNQNAINELTFTGTEFTNVFSASTSGFQLGTTGGGYLSFLTNNAERMRIDSSGNVGIATTNFTTTGAKLQVKGTSASPVISGANFTGSIFSVEGTSTVNISMGTTGASSYDGWIQVHDAGNGSNYDLLLNPIGGNVGIGTSSPSYKLHLSGTIADQQPLLLGTVTGTPSAAFNWVAEYMAANLAQDKRIVIALGKARGTNNSATISYVQRADADNNAIAFGHFGANDLVNFTYNGNVGIGTTTPINTTAKVISAITAASGSGNSYTTATDTGNYSSRGSIEVGGITNRYIISTGLSGNFAANTWYPIMKRSDMVAASGNTSTMENGGFGMYFRIYAYSSSIGLGEYFTNHMSEMVWIHNVGANSNQAPELRIGAGFGHAPNTGHNVDDPSNNPIRLRLAHHYGNDSTWAGEQTLEIRFNVAITGANPASVGRQIIVKGYML